MRQNHKWTDEERAIIRRDFKHSRESCKQLAKYLSFITKERITQYSIRGQVTSMGIAKNDDRHPWSPEEIERLKELMPRYSPRRVAEMMHRSINSVTVKSKRVSISRRCRNGWFTKSEVMEILGHDHRWVQRRIDSGTLKATYHYDRRPSQLGGSAWHVAEEDLKKFIKTYPEELVGCNIDIITIVDIISGVNNNQHQSKPDEQSSDEMSEAASVI